MTQASEFYLASSPPQGSFIEEGMPLPPGVKPHPERMPPLLADSPKSRCPLDALNTTRPKPLAVKKAKWHLGIRSQSRPYDIMAEVYRAMRQLSFDWKVTGHIWHMHIHTIQCIQVYIQALLSAILCCRWWTHTTCECGGRIRLQETWWRWACSCTRWTADPTCWTSRASMVSKRQNCLQNISLYN